MLLSRFVGLFLLNLPCADKDDTAESRKYHPFRSFVQPPLPPGEQASLLSSGGTVFAAAAVEVLSVDFCRFVPAVFAAVRNGR